jgi:hypothetical protein
VENEPKDGFERHAEEQRERWLKLTPEQRLLWLERAKRFARMALAAPRAPRREPSDGDP